MKDYPSIPRATGTSFREIPGALIFDKLDGSSMRSEWSKKRGWYKHGKRSGLVDDSNPHLVQVPKLFMETLAEPLTHLALAQRWQNLVVFYEFWGEYSFAGLHFDGDEKKLTVFDAAPDKRGILGPQEFRRIFEGKVDTPAYLGTTNFTRGYVERVRQGEIEGITFEGVVAKAGDRHDIIRAKAKTQAWIDKVIELHGEEAGKRIVNS